MRLDYDFWCSTDLRIKAVRDLNVTSISCERNYGAIVGRSFFTRLLATAWGTEVVDVGANPIDEDPPYKTMLSDGLCRVMPVAPCIVNNDPRQALNQLLETDIVYLQDFPCHSIL
jgi:hypothetical protein